MVARNASEAEVKTVGGNVDCFTKSLCLLKVASKEARMREDRQQEDMRLVTQLDQKVSDQQVGAF